MMRVAVWKAAQATTLSKLGSNPTSKKQLVFPNTKNTMLAVSKVDQIMTRIVNKFDGLKKLKVHGMRHTWCSLLFESGTNLNQVKSILGHRDSKTTLNVYTTLG
jgi:site-specific recombinase XerD